MKNIYSYILLLSLLLAFRPAEAQTYHSWAGSYGNMTFNDGRTHIVFLDGEVTITGTITVDNKTSLRFLGRNNPSFTGTVTIRNGLPTNPSTEPMFRVIGEAKLSFNYYDIEDAGKTDAELAAKYRPIIIDGGADFSPMDKTSDPDGVWRLTAGSGARKFGVSLIESIGAIEMYNVTIRNVYFPENVDICGIIGLATETLQSTLPSSANTNLQYRYTTLKNCTIENCKGSYGTVVYVHNCAYLNRDIDPNGTDRFGSHRFITLDGVTVRNCVTFGDSSGWGGLIRCRGASVYSMILKNCIFEGNFSHNDGAVLWWNANGHKNTKCTIDGCTFRNNRAMRDAGALRLEGSFEFTGNKTIVSGNECFGKKRVKGTPDTYVNDPDHPGNGGGIQIYGYAGTKDGVSGTLTYNLPSCLEVKDNYAASSGGGISFNITTESQMATGTVINADFNGAVINGNQAGKRGGGIYFSNTADASKGYVINVNLNSGTMSGNTAPNGGGFYVKDIDINSRTISESITIKDNTASAGCGGGVYIENGDITLNSVNVTGNKAYKVDDNDIYGGGGLFVKTGSFTINSGSISDNHTDHYGGGVLVYNNTSEQQTITLTNGLISRNNSLYGGGIASYGAINLDVNNITLESNVAHNGGGVFALGSGSDSGTTLNYKSGIIRYNRAQSHEASPLSTAYDLDYKAISGIGGGIYMGQYSYLKFENPADFGIYENVADNGADDIFGYNRNVDIKLPDVADLKLDGYSTANAHDLFWAEDYITNDTNYNKGTGIKSSWDTDKTNKRYRNAGQDERYLIDFGGESVIHYPIVDGSSTYLSLTLGWTVSTLTLVKHGMNDGDNAIFKIYKVDGTETEYMTVILTDRDKQADGSRVKRITLSSDGVWKVVETGWSWTYTPDKASIQKNLTVSSTDDDRTFTFSNSHDSGTTITDEAVMINEMTNQ